MNTYREQHGMNELMGFGDSTPEGIIRAWAQAYRDTPRYRFPSDPNAEFFPVDLEAAAAEIERLRAALAPFAEVAKHITAPCPDSYALMPLHGLTAKHFRNAAAALRAKASSTEPGEG